MKSDTASLASGPSSRVPRIAIFEDSVTAIERYKTEVFCGHSVQLSFFPSSLLPPEDADRLAGFDPDLIVLDLIMEKDRMDGYSLLKKLSEDPRFSKRPVIVCSKLISSSDAGRKVRQRVLGLGAKAAFSKFDGFPTYEELVEQIS
jgi:CheY-like chemotaxis protein